MTFYALRRINEYENIILNISNTIESIKLQLKIIDNNGHFEADDEVGSIFDSIKEIINELNDLTEGEVSE